MAILNPIASNWSRSEREKINNNWTIIESYLSNLQGQINLLTGDVDVQALIDQINDILNQGNVVIADLEAALQDASTVIANARNATTEANNAAQEAKNAINDMQAFINNFGSLGTWSSTTQYFKNNLVENDGQTYIALKENINIPVTDKNTWALFAGRGGPGEKGDPGVGLNILGVLTDFSQLPAVGNPGDAYMVDGSLYIWSGDTNSWEDSGSVTALNVMHYGAVGDGITDDTQAIQNALNSLNIIFFPAGTYLITDTLIINSNTTIYGVKGKSIIKIDKNFETSKVMLKNATITGETGVYYDSDICIKDLVFDANNNPMREAGVIVFYKVQNSKFKGITIKNSTQTGLALSGCMDIKVEDSLFTNIGRGLNSTVSTPALWTDTMEDGTRPKNITVSRCIFIDNTWSGCYFMPDHGSISNCEFINCGESSIFTNKNGNNISYIDNYIHGAKRTNISASGIEVGGHNIVIKGNKIYNCDSAGVSLTDVCDVVVTDNIIKNNGQDINYYTSTAGIDLITLDMEPESMRDIIISNNIISDDQVDISKTQHYGIQLVGEGSSIKNTFISNNIFVGNQVKPILLSLGKWGEGCFTKDNVGDVSSKPSIGVFQTPEILGEFSVSDIGFKPRMVELYAVLSSVDQNYYFSSKISEDFTTIIATATDANGSSALPGTQPVLLIDSTQSILTSAKLVEFFEGGFKLNFETNAARPWINYVAYP